MKKCLVFLYAITFLLGIVSISGAKSVLFSSKNLFYYNINSPQSYHCYGGDPWSTMTSILDAATGNDVHVAPDFENLDQMLNYDALFVCLRSHYIDPPITAIEVNNISHFIETGRRVVLVGENPFWTSWNEIIIGIVGGSLDPFTPNWYGTYGTGFTSHSIVENYLTNGVGSIYCTGSLAIGGTALFDYAVATLWGDNVLTVLTTNVFEEGTLNSADNKQFATNIANWIVGLGVVSPPVIVNDKVDFVVKGFAFDSTVERTPVLDTKTGGEMNLLGSGCVLDQLYGLNNLKRIDNDQIWTNLDGGATAKAKYTSRNEQTLCYIGADGEFQQIFTETGNGFGVSCSGTIPGKDILPTFRWALKSSVHTWSSQPSDNSDGADHMVTWLIKAGPCAGKFVIAWEDLDGLGDKDYQDLVVEIDKVSTTDQIGTFTITAELTNTSVENINIYEPVKAVVNTLEYTDNVLEQFPLILLSATEGDGTKGSKQTIDVGEGVLIPNESVTVDFVIGLSVRSRFSFFVDVEGCL